MKAAEVREDGAVPVAWITNDEYSSGSYSPPYREKRLSWHRPANNGTPLYTAALTDDADRLREVLRRIGDMAHDASTGPAVPDVLWEIRRMAYDEI